MTKKCKKPTKAAAYAFHCLCCNAKFVIELPKGMKTSEVPCPNCDPYGMNCQAVFISAALSNKDIATPRKINVDMNRLIYFIYKEGYIHEE